MKTRIRKKEYNNGKIEYICEKASFPEIAVALFTLSLVCLLAFFYYLNEYSICFVYLIGSFGFLSIGIRAYKDRWNLISYKINHAKHDYNAIFDDLDGAKRFIDEELKKEADSKLEEHGNEIKKQTIIKHP